MLPDALTAQGWTTAASIFKAWLDSKSGTFNALPFPADGKHRLGYRVQFEKIVTVLQKGESRPFAIMNYERVEHVYDSLKHNIEDAVQQGIWPIPSLGKDSETVERSFSKLVDVLRKGIDITLTLDSTKIARDPHSLAPLFLGAQPIEGYDETQPVDELVATLANFGLKLYAIGEAGLTRNPQGREKVNLSVKEWLVRINDGFTFDGAQYLGSWGEGQFNPIDSVITQIFLATPEKYVLDKLVSHNIISQTTANEIFEASLRSEPLNLLKSHFNLTNNDMREFMQKYRLKEFYIYSDFHVISKAPAKFEIML